MNCAGFPVSEYTVKVMSSAVEIYFLALHLSVYHINLTKRAVCHVVKNSLLWNGGRKTAKQEA